MASSVVAVQGRYCNGFFKPEGAHLSSSSISSRGFCQPHLHLLRGPALCLPPLRLRQAIVTVRAAGGPDAETPQKQSQFGLGGPGTWFGFGRRQESAVGRLAMVGFVAGVVMEVLTGKGVLAQLGINAGAVRYPFLAGLTFLFVAGLLGGYVVIQNPPDFEKIPENEGAGAPRDPLKTFDPQTVDPLTTWTRGKKGEEPYASDLDLPPSKKKE